MNKKITCFNAHKKLNKNCNNKECRHWSEIVDFNNCVIIKSNEKTHTLQEIGDVLNISRMRVCQIEKSILNKLKKSLEH
jgi:DNA-directed RNA polymerase specialized sigma subunit